MSSLVRHTKRTARNLVIGFAAIMMVIVAAQFARSITALGADEVVDESVDNALQSIEVLGRIAVTLERWRLLIERHLLDGLAERQTFERQVAHLKSSLNADGRSYEPLVTFPGEKAAWNRVQQDIERLQETSTELFANSPQQSDARARREIERLDPIFGGIERDVDALIAINRTTASEAHHDLRARQQRAIAVSIGLSALAVAATAIIAAIVIPLITRRQERIERYSIELESRNRELDAFAGRVAHDLRGPLTAISLSASRLTERLPQEEGVTAIMSRGVRRMEGLIEDLLALSRIDAQVTGIARTADVARAVEAELSARVSDAGGELYIAVEPAEVRCSPGLLHQVLWNLGENAVKFRRKEAALRLEILGRPTHSHYEFRVRDNGCGMSPVELHHAFEPFFRGAQTAASTPGTGLGLSIVKRVIDAAGGTMAVESSVGDGTTFRFTIPLASSERRAA